ncbi:DUF6069 family protein [Actinoplanes rectilineatus]|uniref:DUF6069 family protein n=1 Tax=Actinoplanes rectilineatus TaxID=113571 RepID=UPI0005F28FCF|nr:DUF6069 family protein [Actinoplanes rectilineatus]
MTTTTHAVPDAAPGPIRIGAAIGAAVIVDLLVLWAASAAGATLEIDAPYDLDAGAVIVSTAVPMLAGTALVLLLARRFPAARRRLTWGGAAFALVTAAMPFTAADDTATAVALALMHVTVGIAWIAATAPRPTGA